MVIALIYISLNKCKFFVNKTTSYVSLLVSTNSSSCELMDIVFILSTRTSTPPSDNSWLLGEPLEHPCKMFIYQELCLAFPIKSHLTLGKIIWVTSPNHIFIRNIHELLNIILYGCFKLILTYAYKNKFLWWAYDSAKKN